MEIRSVELHRAAYKPEDFPGDDRSQFAIVGRSNVGKSSLINTVLNRKGVARTSQTPGKTQAIHFYLINEKIYIVDLPGYGYAKVPRDMARSWGALAKQYFESSMTLKVVFLLLDVRRIPTEDDLMMRDWMNGAGVPWVAVLTKVDKFSGNQLAKARKEIAATLQIESKLLINFSKVTRAGLADLWRVIENPANAANSK